jgi:Stress responsive A/B Barrel Domain
MFRLIKLIKFSADATDADRERLAAVLLSAQRALPQILECRLQTSLAASPIIADVVWRVSFADERSYRGCLDDRAWREIEGILTDPSVAHVDSAAFPQESFSLREPGLRNGFYRVLFVAKQPGIDGSAIAQYEAEQRDMARYIPQISNWSFGRVAEGDGARRWDYVWEQEFQDYAEWNRVYMAHPYHWARIHRWFDPESPEFMHDPWFALGVAPCDSSLLAGG